MPTYQYACTECAHRFEAVQSFSDDTLSECPQCSGRLRKVYSSVGVVFKGSGFYRTDSRAGDNGESSSKSGSESGSSSKTGSAASSSSDGSGASSSSGSASSSSSASSSGSASSDSSAKSSSPAAAAS